MTVADDVAALSKRLAATEEKIERMEKEKATVDEVTNLRNDARASHDEQTAAIEEAKGLAVRAEDRAAALEAADEEMNAAIADLAARPTAAGGTLYDEYVLPREGFEHGLYRELIPGSSSQIVIRYLNAKRIGED